MFLPCSDRETYNWLTTASKFSPCCAEAVRGGLCLAFYREQSEKCCRFHSGWINHKLWFHRLHSTLTWSLYPSATASERRQDQFTKCRRWEWPIGISGDVEAVGSRVLLAACSDPSVCQCVSVEAAGSWQGRGGAGQRTWAWHHLHSTATVFCVGEAEDGLMPVSDEPDDVDAVVWDTSLSFFFNLFRLLSMEATSDLSDM